MHLNQMSMLSTLCIMGKLDCAKLYVDLKTSKSLSFQYLPHLISFWLWGEEQNTQFQFPN